MDGAQGGVIDARKQRRTTTMVAVAIAAHIGPRSERGDGNGMMFCGYLIPADETATAADGTRTPARLQLRPPPEPAGVVLPAYTSNSADLRIGSGLIGLLAALRRRHTEVVAGVTRSRSRLRLSHKSATAARYWRTLLSGRYVARGR
jgi:hypothetical protein